MGRFRKSRGYLCLGACLEFLTALLNLGITLVKAKSKKKPVKAKAKRRAEIAEPMSPEAQRKAERRVKKLLDEMDERADERYEYAMKILEANPDSVEEAVERMVKTMRHMAGPPRFVVDGQAINVEPEILERIQRKSHTWVAVRLLVACAKWDIRIANFMLPKKVCADCGVRVKR